MSGLHPIFDTICTSFFTAPRRKYMVQVWDHERAPGAKKFSEGKWTDYWPVYADDMKHARVKARQALSPFWQAKRWRVIECKSN